MIHVARRHTRGNYGWQLGEAETGDVAGTATLLHPGEGEKVNPIHARICDESCKKPASQAPLGSCSGLCKKSGDAHGVHEGQHLCNTCGYQW